MSSNDSDSEWTYNPDKRASAQRDALVGEVFYDPELGGLVRVTDVNENAAEDFDTGDPVDELVYERLMRDEDDLQRTPASFFDNEVEHDRVAWIPPSVLEETDRIVSWLAREAMGYAKKSAGEQFPYAENGETAGKMWAAIYAFEAQHDLFEDEKNPQAWFDTKTP